MCEAANRPWPVIDEADDVIDFLVMEAVAIKVQREEVKAAQEQKKAEWKRDHEGLDRLKSIAG